MTGFNEWESQENGDLRKEVHPYILIVSKHGDKYVSQLISNTTVNYPVHPLCRRRLANSLSEAMENCDSLLLENVKHLKLTFDILLERLQ